MRWRVGDGSNIRVWLDPWSNDDSNFFVRAPVVDGLENLRVVDLFLPNAAEWDTQKVGLLKRLQRFHGIFQNDLIWNENQAPTSTIIHMSLSKATDRQQLQFLEIQMVYSFMHERTHLLELHPQNLLKLFLFGKPSLGLSLLHTVKLILKQIVNLFFMHSRLNLLYSQRLVLFCQTVCSLQTKSLAYPFTGFQD
ncbi:hypothetical protein K2173_008282 [Erythroxylum novogranatense]|uniref:Uncharacterized protein n=1 Tax=Erythroxylum novogranatense TaxID=1862640 RepID=A0AAV8U6T8_9ROSI|nr:hypothetical protein K2173_008282 [Erythroxylum novogranatense]